MKRNYTEILSLFLTGLIFLAACESKPGIGLLMDTTESSRRTKEREIFISYINDAGGEVICGDAGTQYTAAKTMLEKGIEAMVIIPSDPISASEIARLAARYGVPVIAYDRNIYPGDVACLVTFDNVQIGELQAKCLVSECPRGKYAIIGGVVNDNNSSLIRAGQFNILRQHIESGVIKIVYENYVDYWSEDEGYRLMNECLQKYGVIDALLAVNDQIAGGAIKALREHPDRPWPKVAGCGASDEACRRIIAGTQTMTVYKPAEALAAISADVVMRLVREHKLPKTNCTINAGIPAVLVPAMEVDSKVIKLTIDARDYYSKQQKVRYESN